MSGEVKSANSILVVDDESANIMALTHILRPVYTVYAEKSGQGTLETAAELMPDIILLDIMLPDMDGYSVLKALKSNEMTRKIPVIFITGLSGIENEEKGLILGAADYIVKPFIPVIVKLRVANQIKLINNMRMLMEKEVEERSFAAKMEFYTCMNHDMLTPMNVIMGMTKIAKMSNDGAKIRECLDDIDDASRELLGMLKTLLELK